MASICIQNTPYSLKGDWKNSKEVLMNKVISTIQKWAPEFKKGIYSKVFCFRMKLKKNTSLLGVIGTIVNCK